MLQQQQASFPLVDGLRMPSHYRGELFVNGRRVWWTGRVAIGLHYQSAPQRVLSASHERLQQALLPVAVERRAA
jgi:hypothetical protein